MLVRGRDALEWRVARMELKARASREWAPESCMEAAFRKAIAAGGLLIDDIVTFENLGGQSRCGNEARRDFADHGAHAAERHRASSSGTWRHAFRGGDQTSRDSRRGRRLRFEVIGDFRERRREAHFVGA